MEEKFDVTTFFRTVIPGYVFLFVLYTLQPIPQEFISSDSVSLLALAGLPIGYLVQELNRFILYFIRWEERFDKRDLVYLVVHKGLRRDTDLGIGVEQISKKRKNIFQYSTCVDYLLLTTPKLKSLNGHLRFLYTRLHAYLATTIAIFFGLVYCFISNFSNCSTKFLIIIFWIIIALALICTRIETAERISWWRRQIIDRNQPEIRKFFSHIPDELKN